MPGKISGEGYASLHLNATMRHDAAYDSAVATLPIGGFYRQRHGGETHAYSAQLMHTLQTAVATDSYSTYLQFSRGVRDLPPVYLRDLLEFNFPTEGVAIDQVEAITEIRKRFARTSRTAGREAWSALVLTALNYSWLGDGSVDTFGRRHRPDASESQARARLPDGTGEGEEV